MVHIHGSDLQELIEITGIYIRYRDSALEHLLFNRLHLLKERLIDLIVHYVL